MNREQIANAAWFLYRMMPAVTGCRQAQMEKTLLGYTAKSIVEEAGSIQDAFHSETANGVQKLLVG